jgi:xanthine dehydrogenase small subunit
MLRFIVNGAPVALDKGPETVALDAVRGDLGLTGTKEACREGDCGACAVLVGELREGRVRYRAVCSCLLPLGDLEGRHLVTIEGLNGEALSPVQRALVDGGGIQCGFCTPGLVVALTGYLLEAPAIDPAGAELGVAGNLCRCTGYAGIRRAVALLATALPDIGRVGPERVRRLIALGVLPGYFDDVPRRLIAIERKKGTAGTTETRGAVPVGGGTDLFSQKKADLRGKPLRFLLREEAFRGIAREGDRLEIGAATTAAELMESEETASLCPELRAHLELFASPLVRGRATVGGNLANASPIGDLAIILLALGATLVLERDGARRTLPIEGLWLGYKKLALGPGELITRIAIPIPEAGARFRFEKVSRRRMLDIAGVNSALAIAERDGAISAARLSAGGVAPIPLLLAGTSRALVGRPIREETVRAAVEGAISEVAPIDDVRGSAAYKRTLLGRLVRGHFAALYPERVRPLHGEAP